MLDTDASDKSIDSKLSSPVQEFNQIKTYVELSKSLNTKGLIRWRKSEILMQL
jgi:hypothetical protein